MSTKTTLNLEEGVMIPNFKNITQAATGRTGYRGPLLTQRILTARSSMDRRIMVGFKCL